MHAGLHQGQEPAREQEVPPRGRVSVVGDRVRLELRAGGGIHRAGAEAAPSRFLEQAAKRFGWSGRSLHRVLKVARTIADLGGAEAIAVVHLAEALQFRRALLSA